MRYFLSSLILLLAFVTTDLYAGVNTYSYKLSGSGVANGAIIENQDDQYVYMTTVNPAGWSSEFTNQEVINRVSLKYEDAARVYYSTPWNINVTCTLKRWDASGTQLADEIFTLAIDYKPGAQLTHSNLNVFTSSNGHKTQLIIGNVVKAGVGSVPTDVLIESEIEVERYYAFDLYTPTTASNSGVQADNTLNIRWDFLPGAEEYDLEWLFVSAYADPSAISSPDFSKATRITTTQQQHTLNLVYDEGYIFYRVRGVGRAGSDFAIPMPGQWTATSTQVPVNNTTLNSRNWQYQAAYAEDGKTKEVVSFFDGSLRNRQTVTKANTADAALITESFYDYEGRPAVSTLPAPDATRQKELKFYEQLTLTTGFNLYDRKAFDGDQYTDVSCNQARPTAMSKSEGAGQYYSSYNNSVSVGYNAFIPDAGLAPWSDEDGTYPFLQTFYGIDGRVKKQSGAGGYHTIGSGHETEFFYATPLQQQLDRLFGNEAGYAEHYSLKAQVDPNGQLSVSYLDLAGNVVATALSGEAPSNLDALPNNVSAQTVYADFNNQNSYVESEEAYIVRSRFLVTSASPTVYTFDYYMSPEQYYSLCSSTTHNCDYDLTITIYDDCHNAIKNSTYTISGTLFANPLPNPLPYHQQFAVQFPKIGTYTIEKKLTINAAAIANALAAFGQASSDCYPSLASLKNDFNAALDMSECDPCTTGCSELPSEDHCDVLYQHLVDDMSKGGQYFDNRTVADENNSSFTPNNSWLNYSGQTSPAIEPNVWQDCDQQAWDVANFRDNNGNLITSWQDLRDKWNPAFATKAFDGTVDPLSNNCTSGTLLSVVSQASINGRTALVQFHPEYCTYKWCDVMGDVGSDVFDAGLFESDSYSWATANPSLAPYITFPINGDPVGINLLDADPFFDANTTTGVTATDYTDMKNYMTDTDPGIATVSLWSLAGTYVSTGCSGSACDDEQWQIFRGLYLAKKREVIEVKKSAYELALNCREVCDDVSTSAPDNISDLCAGGPPFSGFRILEPDNYNYLNTTSSTTIQSQLTTAYQATCNTPASATYRVGETSVLACPAYYLQASGGPLAAAINISGTVACTSSVSPAVMIQQMVAAINSYVSSPIDFTAAVDNQDPSTIIITAPASEGANANGITISIPTYTTFTCTTANGVTDIECDENNFNCFCSQLQVLYTTYNAVNPATSQYYIDHTTYTTFENYARTNLNATYGTTVSNDDISAWRASCQATNNGSAEQATDSYPATTVPTELQCDLPPACGEDAEALADFNAEQAYNLLVQAATEDFLYNYKQQCFKTVKKGGLFSEDFRVQFDEREYQYTLYYYDQARNLVRTVPPEAVVPLVEVPNTGPYELTAVKNHREDPVNNAAKFPQHHPSFASTSALVTKYEYNSLNQIVLEDSPDKDLVEYWYDQVARLRFSKNRKQQADGTYSYTRYDALGRVIEVGESNESFTNDAFVASVDVSSFPSTNRTQVTYTTYDNYLNSTVNGLFTGGQENLRTRVATVSFESTGDSDPNTYDNATHYSYDIHGNVHTLVQDITELLQLGQEYKYLYYDYDLVSGNVNEVRYQPGQLDQLYHRYYYDADNRITNVYTSRDGVVWDQDAKYFYYLHGPLARTEIGNEKVQGSDFAYTINGWIKGVNSNTLVRSRDLGEDGLVNSAYMLSHPDIHQNIAADAFGYSLEYFDNDYRAIYNPVNTEFTYDIASVSSPSASLYNGNIRQMATALLQPNANSLPTAMPVMDARYRYDQLNRIVQMDAYTNTTNSFVSGSNTNSKYKTHYTYDKNGNIQSLKRYGDGSYTDPMDDLDYTYDTQLKNRLTDVDELSSIASCAYMDDIDADAISGAVYSYDEIGNLVGDQKEYITNIEWTPYGKVARVIKDKSYKTDCNSNEIVLQDLEFRYDAMGNRICKIVKPHKSNAQGLGLSNEDQWTYTYYVRDAQGNVMGTYKRSYTNPSGSNYEEEFRLVEQDIYGSSRLGLIRTNTMLSMASFSSTGFETDVTSPGLGQFLDKINYDNNPIGVDPANQQYARLMGEKMYEGANHLGNVLVTFSDRKLPVQGTPSTAVDHYLPDVLSASDYYPFGMQMPGRTLSAGDYRYGFQGQETEKELWGGQASFFKYRISDNRLGRFFAVDPLAAKYPYNSPYAFSENRVVDGIELEGLEVVPVNEVWDVSTPTASASGVYTNYDKNGAFKVLKYGNETITLHPILSGPNKGNYLGIVHNGDYSNFWKSDKDAGYTYEEKYVFGAERVPAAAYSQTNDLNLAVEGWIFDPWNWSTKLNFVGWANYLGKGYWDENTGEWVDQSSTSDIWEGWKSEVSNPYNWIAGAHIGVSAMPQANAVNIKAPSYRPVATRTAVINNADVLGYLQKQAPGNWIKVYEAAYLNGQQVEVHYFFHKQTGAYFDSKIKQVGWSDQFTKGANKITGH